MFAPPVPRWPDLPSIEGSKWRIRQRREQHYVEMGSELRTGEQLQLVLMLALALPALYVVSMAWSAIPVASW